MARYRKVDSRIWNDAKFNTLSDGAKLIFFMLLTHPNMTALGAMRATVSGLCEEMGWSLKAFREAFEEVLSKGMAEHDEKACAIALPNFIRYNPPESPNVVKAWANALDLIPESDIRNRAVLRAASLVEDKGKGFAEALPEAFRKICRKSMPNQEQEQEQEQEKDKTPMSDSPSEPDFIGDDLQNRKPKHTPCDHRMVVEVYHQVLPEMRRVVESRWAGSARAKALQARWQESAPKHQTRKFWLWFFSAVRTNPHWMGQNARGWTADLGWLLERRNFDKVVEHGVSNAHSVTPELARQESRWGSAA